MYETRVNDDTAILEQLQKKYNVIGVVKKQAATKKGLLEGLSVVAQSPSSEVVEEYISISDMIISNRYTREVK